jgi:hypothetical protein
MKSTMVEPEHTGCSMRSRKEPCMANVKGNIRMNRSIASLISRRFPVFRGALPAVLAQLHE